MNNKIAPICLFTYNRLTETRQTVEALQRNFLAIESDLYIFSDGSKNKTDKLQVQDVRKYLRTISGFKSITIYESTNNKGLAHSIISGVSQILEKHKNIIALEDDLVTSPNFLNFMNQALNCYETNHKIFSISGYTMDLPSLKNYPKDFYLGHRASSWGWGTWLNRWENIDWEVKDYNHFKYNWIKQLKFMNGGSDLPGMLKNQISGKIDSWAIRWCYDQFKKDMFTVFPKISKVTSIGFGADATHTKKTDRFNTSLDNGLQIDFFFDSFPEMNKNLKDEFRNKFSLINRLKGKFDHII